jgi:hypothetical protein
VDRDRLVEVDARGVPLAQVLAHDAEVVAHPGDLRLVAEAAELRQRLLVALAGEQHVAAAQVDEADLADGLRQQRAVALGLGELDAAARKIERLVVAGQVAEEHRALDRAGRPTAHAAARRRRTRREPVDPTPRRNGPGGEGSCSA